MIRKTKSIVYIGNKLSQKGFTPTGIEYLGPALERVGFDVVYASDKVNPVLRLIDMMLTIFMNRKCGAVLIDTYSSLAYYYALICACVCRIRGLPYVLVLRGGDFPNRKLRSPFLTYQLFRKARKVVAVSRYLQFEMKSFWDCLYIPNIIIVKNYPFLSRPVVRPKLLWVRSFHELYNPNLALDVLIGLLRKFPDSSLTMVGPDKDGSLSKITQRVLHENIGHAVTLTGKLTKADWIELSRGSDIFINTTNFDNMPVSVMEAMALGLVVVSTRVGGIPYLIDENDDGLLVEPNSVDEFVKAIENLIVTPEQAMSFAKKARKKVESFDEEIVTVKWVGLLNEIV